MVDLTAYWDEWFRDLLTQIPADLPNNQEIDEIRPGINNRASGTPVLAFRLSYMYSYTFEFLVLQDF